TVLPAVSPAAPAWVPPPFVPKALSLVRSAHLSREQERVVRRSETRFRALLESAPDGIVIADRDGRIAMVNRQAELLFGYEREELLGRDVETLLPEHARMQHATH